MTIAVTRPHVVIYSDGACKGNPGPGGWGAVIRAGTKEKELSGAENPTTNNRMELTAAIKALEALAQSPGKKVWTAAARFDAVLVTAAMDEAAKAAYPYDYEFVVSYRFDATALFVGADHADR